MKGKDPLCKKMGKKELEYTVMLEDLYRRAMKMKPEELDTFIAEVKEKFPGYPKEPHPLGSRMMKQRYVNGMHASALAGIAAMASVSFGTPGYAISENQASVITHLVHNGFYGRHEYVARVR